MIRKTLVVFILLLITTAFAFAQNNYSNYKVDDLTDAQIMQIVKQAESIGYTSPEQISQLAKARGLKDEEIEKFKQRVEKIKKQGASSERPQTQPKSSVTRQIEGTDLNNDVLNENEKSQSKKNDLSDQTRDIGLKIFGSELFKNKNLTFEPNLRIATPKNYVIGPDDKLLIDLTGDNERSYELQVGTEGYINLEYVGRIAVGGLTIEQATAKIKSAMARTYPALKSGRTSVAINLGNIRSIKVMITGQSVKPGTYTISSLSSVYNALYASGGPSDKGSFRNIQVIRGNKVITTIDTYSVLLDGIFANNIRLQDQDVINIPFYEKRVEIEGEVKREAIFEVKNNETFADVLSFAGGFTTKAYTASIKAFQNTDRERKIIDIKSSDFSGYKPKNGDKYLIEAILDRFANRVEIVGAVFRPGFYALEGNLTLKGLIEKANGLTEDAFLNRGYINRLNPDNTQSLISFDVAKIMSGTQQDITLQREDKITINSLFDLREERTVSIQGEVRAPGTFPYADNLSVVDVIQMAGGLTEGATPKHIEVSRRVKGDSTITDKSKIADVFIVNVSEDLKVLDKEFKIMPFDIISVRASEIYSAQKQVRIEGEVTYPGTYTITSKEYRISDLIKNAGGVTSLAYVDGASLKRPGAAKVNPKDKNAIDDSEEEQKKILNLERIQDSGIKDGKEKKVDEKLIQSDLVGINLEKILQNPRSRIDLILEEGDIIRVPKQLQIVKVTGEVLNPNSIVYTPGKSFREYISGAGGFTGNAKKSGAYIKYANGAAESTKKFLFFNNYPKVKPGAEILVPIKPEREKITAQAWIGIGTGIASLAAIIVSLLK
ncbi:SLBB domain-containing protein [Pedobacter montanisoli]|uniref:SLBB domain-containing protein n=1 Tax=Pedobacter montanisoli TaxID=2923277 RepID=A0ABS9ZV26_9SPHI|nr:SLBB domain-containing protein [Pedobacter montanisoli]MCJ0741518.1 SLBB domain-containing protein [Pedobacter montanisoli]